MVEIRIRRYVLHDCGRETEQNDKPFQRTVSEVSGLYNAADRAVIKSQRQRSKMIPLYKLEKLPRIQKLRKIAKVFSFAENRLCMAAEKRLSIFSQAELEFFRDAANLLAKDALFSDDAKKFFKETAEFFKTFINNSSSAENTDIGGSATTASTAVATTASTADDSALLLRTLNGVKHILLAETGKDQSDWDFTGSDGHLDPQKRQIIDGMIVYMEDIRSPFNIGAMFRTAESFGVEKIILSPFCADPRHKRAERTAMGCTSIIPWERKELFASDNDDSELDAEPQIPVFALETGGIPIAEFPFPRRGIMITGSEELGVSPRALSAADASLGRVSIPCYGTKASLNVSTAFGIALHAWRESISNI